MDGAFQIKIVGADDTCALNYRKVIATMPLINELQICIPPLRTLLLGYMLLNCRHT